MDNGILLTVIYIDMDYFFAACEELRHPELKGKPLVVGTYDEKNMMKGVVQTCNYEARKYGIRSGTPTKKAYELYKDLKYIAADDNYYEEMSNRVMTGIRSYGFVVEQDSIDEAAVDLGRDCSYEKAVETAKNMKAKINAEFGLPCTVGISFGKMFAKMMCDASKPNGFDILKEDEIKKFLSGKPVGKLPGIGPKTEEKLKGIGISKIDELAAASPAEINDLLGSVAAELCRLANGVDDSKIIGYEETLSIGRERTMLEETKELSKIKPTVEALSKEVAAEAEKKGFWFKNVGIKVRYSDFTQVTRSKNLSHYLSSEKEIYENAMLLFKDVVKEKSVRKVGVRVATLMEAKKQRKLI